MPRARLVDLAAWKRRRRHMRAARRVSAYLRRVEAALTVWIDAHQRVDVLDARYRDIRLDIRRGIRGVERLFDLEEES
jgi:protein associated with RNAse G/E